MSSRRTSRFAAIHKCHPSEVLKPLCAGPCCKANQAAVVDEKKRKEAPEDYARQLKKKLYDAQAKKRDELAEARGIDPGKKHLLETAEKARPATV